MALLETELFWIMYLWVNFSACIINYILIVINRSGILGKHGGPDIGQ